MENEILNILSKVPATHTLLHIPCPDETTVTSTGQAKQRLPYPPKRISTLLIVEF